MNKQDILWLGLILSGLICGSVQAQTLSEKELRSKAEAGNAEAQYQLGLLYDRKPKTRAQALEWYERAAEQNHRAALRAACDDHLAIIPVNGDKTVHYCRIAAQDGYNQGYWRIGEGYETGRWGLSPDMPKAISIYTELLEWGHYPANRKLGDIYYEGKNGSPDYHKAFSLLQEAFGSRPQINAARLAYMYENGLGTEKNIAEAHRLYRYAASLNNADALAWLGKNAELSAEIAHQDKLIAADLPENSFVLAYRKNNPTLNELYPPKAMDSEIEGAVLLECLITADGDLKNCIAVEETPADYNFGKMAVAALSLLGAYNANPEGLKAYSGKTYTYRFNWTLR
ncbi:MAG: energy transducer TonB [Asticcacaulis sp.]